MCDLAHYNEQKLYQEFGVNAEFLIDHAKGKETCTIQDIKNYAIPCRDTDLFVRLEEKLNNDYPEYKNYDTYFLVNGRRIRRFKTLKENNIKERDLVCVFRIDDDNLPLNI